jgi:hypothetical protein
MNKFTKILFLWIFFFSSIVHAEIIKMNNPKEIQDHVDILLRSYSPQDIWVVFDIYHTLVQPKHPATHAKNMMEKHKIAFKEIFQPWTSSQQELALNQSIEHEKGLTLVSSDFPELIASLQEEGGLVLALTTSFSGNLGNIKDLREWTYDYFRSSLKIDFAKATPFYFVEQKFVADNKPNNPGFYYKGIFFTNGENGLTKGEALVLMLAHEARPRVLMVVDDREKNLLDMQQKLGQFDQDIKFIGIHFTGAFEASNPCTEIEFRKFWNNLIR